ncbi:MAG: TonB-dependent receptor [Janthinobacterium lividum]
MIALTSAAQAQSASSVGVAAGQAEAPVGPAQQPVGAPAMAGDAAIAAQATATPPDSAGIQDIVITAQRRAESAQKASLAIAVVSGAALQAAGVSQPETLNKLVPGLKLTNAATTSIYVRGVGENSSNQNTQSAIAVSVDGNYIGRTSGVAGNFYDIQRIELLKGPQGTLYGRNASGGALNIITNAPTEDFGGYVTTEVGDYSLRRVTAALNVPVTDTLAVRGAIFDSKRDGYLSDGFQDEDIRGGRLRLAWTPNSRLKVAVFADISRIAGLGEGAALFNQGWTGYSETPRAIASRAALGVTTFGVPGQRYYNKSISGQIDYDLGFATLTFQPGYRDQTFNAYSETATSALQSSGGSHQFTFEARLARTYDAFKYVIGAYSFDEYVHYLYHFDTYQGTLVDTDQNVRKFNTQSRAVFGEATYNVTDRFRAILGGRYTNEKRIFDAYLRWYGPSFGFPHTNTPDPTTGITPPLVSPDPLSGKTVPLYTYADVGSPSFHNVSGKAGFEYDLAPRSLLYATVATGFKSGGFSLQPAPYNVYQPEKLTAFTLGSKNRLFDNRVQLNIESFYWKYKNQQISHLGYDVNGAAGFVTDNAGSSRLFGADVDFQWSATTADTFAVNLEYLDAKVETYTLIVPQFGPFSSVSAAGCKLSPAGTNVNTGAPLNLQDCSGFRLPFTSTWSGTMSYSHTFDLGQKGSIIASAFAQYATRSYLDFDRRVANSNPGYISPDFDLTYTTESKMFSISAYVRNANNQKIYNTLNSVNVPAVTSLRAPRTFGGRATVKF